MKVSCIVLDYVDGHFTVSSISTFIMSTYNAITF